MTKRLTPYGSAEHAPNISKVGLKKTSPMSLVARMPTADIAAKVGPIPISMALGSGAIAEAPAFRILRRNAQD